MLKFLKNSGLLEALIGSMQDGLLILDINERHIFENSALRKMLGFSKEELAGTTAPFPYWPPEEIDNIFSAYHKAMAGEIIAFELVFMHKDGTRIWVIISPSELRDEYGTKVGHFATIKDISERKRLEQALQESEQRWRSIAENPFDFVVVIDRQYRFVYVNHTAAGITPDMLIGKATPFDYTDPVNHDLMRNAFQSTFETGKATSYDVYVPQLDAWYSSIVGPIKENGVVTSISVLTREITQQKRAEEALRQSEHQLRESHKMQSIGTLAGGIAHDLNNLLTPILGYSELVQNVLPKESAAREYIDGIVKAGVRARDLVQRILLFSRRREAKKEQVDLGAHVREGIQLIKATAPANIDITLELSDHPLFIFADPSQIHQVLTNLATNGLHAMRDTHGSLKISLYQGLLGAPHLKSKIGEAILGEYAHLTVRDSGVGMDEETQRRAFEPFYSTKAVGSGTGLGLSIVHGIVLEHGGFITLNSKVGEGSVFTVSLPLSQVQTELKKINTQPRLKITHEPKRILCIDDEPEILEIIRQSLIGVGHAITTSTNPIEALILYEKNPKEFDLIITDQTMPKMLGINLAQKVKVLRSSLPCIIMTGFGDETFEKSCESIGINAILAKPFMPTELVECVERVLFQESASTPPAHGQNYH